MKALQTKQLDEKDTIITETLVSLGMNKNIALLSSKYECSYLN